MRPQLPHVPPMHWLDSATLSADGLTSTATRLITSDHPFVEDGHLLPSALIELMAQAAAAGAALKSPAPKRGFLASMRDFHILAPVPIHSTLTLRATHLKTLGPLSLAALTAHINESPVATAHMTFHLTFE